MFFVLQILVKFGISLFNPILLGLSNVSNASHVSIQNVYTF